jgi:hypothetical protein
MGVTTILPSQIDVYIVSHDPSMDMVFKGRQCVPSDIPSYQLDLVLRKWYPMDRTREFGISFAKVIS